MVVFRPVQKELERKAIDMYLRAWNTQESIAKELGVTHQTISNILAKKVPGNEICKDFKPFLYNIWNQSKRDNEPKLYGIIPDRLP